MYSVDGRLGKRVGVFSLCHTLKYYSYLVPKINTGNKLGMINDE